ncbi:MAG: hypothetical protein LBI42_12335 [Chitinispirillales bacterium]|jgi:hypothetical protein|nr:hypothetical protein [Chitinispirillales bacterium]
MFQLKETYTTGLFRQHSKRCFLFGKFVFLLILFCCSYASALSFELPVSELDLSALLEEELIDSFQYEQLLVYYALPVSVPQGELSLLAPIFPELKELIPDTRQLEVYQPFDNRQIQRLFNDFPFLTAFEPILRFNVSLSSHSSNGEIIFGINKSPVDEPKGQRVRFRQKSAFITTDGSMHLSDTGALWQNRSAHIITQNVNASLGNFKQPVPGELFFGVFQPLTDENESVLSNWLYGGSRSWNGFTVEMNGLTAGASVLGAGAFYHIRPNEKGAGGGININAGRGLRVYVGLTGFKADDSIPLSINTAHFYSEYKTKVWKAVFETGMPLERESFNMPLSFRLSYRVKGSSAEYHLLRFSSEFTSPMSRIRRLTLAEIGEKEFCEIQKHSLKMAVPLMSKAKLTPEIDFTESGGVVRRVYGGAKLRARFEMVDFTAGHSSKIFTSEIDSVFHTSGLSLYLQTPYPLGIRAAGERTYGSYKRPRASYSLDLQSSMLPNMIITPFIRGRYSLEERQLWIGLKNELHLYKKTWTNIAVEIPFGVKGDDNVYLKGSSSFTF